MKSDYPICPMAPKAQGNYCNPVCAWYIKEQGCAIKVITDKLGSRLKDGDVRSVDGLPDNFWTVIGERDATIKQQKVAIENLKSEDKRLHDIIGERNVLLDEIEGNVNASRPHRVSQSDRKDQLTASHIESINRRLSDKYDLICDERSRGRFERLLNDIDYDIKEYERREVREP